MIKRQKRLLELLLINPDFKPVSFYANALRISPRSVHNYLSSLEYYFKDLDMYIDRKQGTGIRLVGGNSEKLKMSLELEMQFEKKPEIAELTTKNRQRRISEMLILEEQIITYQKLADMFYVSVSSIAKDINVISRMFDGLTAQLMSTRKGTIVVGTELQKQNTMVKFVNSILKEEKIYDIENGFKDLKIFLTKYFDKDIIDVTIKKFEKLRKEAYVNVGEKYIHSLLIMLVVFLTRLKKGKHPIINRDFIFNEIKQLDTYVIAEQLVKGFSNELQIEYTASDIDYVNKQLIAHNMQLTYQSSSHDEFSNEVRKLIQVMSEVLEINLNQDQKLYESLLSHFTPMLYRLKMNIHIKNPLLNEIKEQYSVVFSSMWYAISTIETNLNVQMTDNEISFLCVHFQIAAERNYNGKKILIVCPNGIGVSELLYNKVQKIVPCRDTIEISTKNSLYERDLSQVDLIISAVNIDAINIPVVKVSALITNDDIKRINEVYTDMFYTRETDTIDVNCFKRVAKMIDSKYIFTDKKMSSKEECLDFMITKLMRDNVVNDYFRESVFAREEQGETDMLTGVALPHAPPEHVIKSTLAIMTLENSITWHNQKVDVVLLLALSKNDKQKVKAILSEIYTLVNSRKRVEYYFLGNSNKEILELLS